MGDLFWKDEFINRINALWHEKGGGTQGRGAKGGSKALGRMLGVSYTTIDRWRKGEGVENITHKQYLLMMSDPQTPGRSAPAVHEDRPPYGISEDAWKALEPYLPGLATIYEGRQAFPNEGDAWDWITGNIKMFAGRIEPLVRPKRRKAG